MNINEYLDSIKEKIKNYNWEELDELFININQQFVNTRNFVGMKEFYNIVLAKQFKANIFGIFRNKWFKRITNRPYTNFKSDVSKILLSVEPKIKNKNVSSIYMEYFFDDVESSEVNLFLCKAFSVEDDDWASNFLADDVFSGGSVAKYMNFDPKFKLDAAEEYIAMKYSDAMLLISAVQAWSDSELTEYPFGFAMHDNSIVSCQT